MAARTCLNIPLYVRCLCCFITFLKIVSSSRKKYNLSDSFKAPAENMFTSALTLPGWPKLQQNGARNDTSSCTQIIYWWCIGNCVYDKAWIFQLTYSNNSVTHSQTTTVSSTKLKPNFQSMRYYITEYIKGRGTGSCRGNVTLVCLYFRVFAICLSCCIFIHLPYVVDYWRINCVFICSVFVNSIFIPSNVNCNFLGAIPLFRYFERNAKSYTRVLVF